MYNGATRFNRTSHKLMEIVTGEQEEVEFGRPDLRMVLRLVGKDMRLSTMFGYGMQGD